MAQKMPHIYFSLYKASFMWFLASYIPLLVGGWGVSIVIFGLGVKVKLVVGDYYKFLLVNQVLSCSCLVSEAAPSFTVSRDNSSEAPQRTFKFTMVGISVSTTTSKPTILALVVLGSLTMPSEPLLTVRTMSPSEF